MIVGSSEDSTATIPRLLQQPHDLRVAALRRHHDQAAIMEPIPFGIGARVQQ